MFVDGNSGGAKNFRELTASDAAEQIHLPEAVLGHDVALGFGHVGQRRGADMRDAPDVAIDGNRVLQTWKRSGAVDLRKGAKKKPPCETAADENEKS